MGPSSRYRIYSYLPYYKRIGLKMEIVPLFGDWYLKRLWRHQSKFFILFKILYAYVYRAFKILFLSSNSLVYVGAELFPYCPFGIERYLRLRKIPYIIEFDDAIFHNYDHNKRKIVRKLLKNKTPKVIRNATAVITGCPYLTRYALQWNQNVLEIPTSIDADKYDYPLANEGMFVVGWIGSPSSSQYLSNVIDALKRFSQHYEFELRLVGFDKKYEKFLDGINYKIVKWTNETEVSEMSKFTVGIMPLPDTPFARGKCAFKLVQYMALGIPTISTPLESNVHIDANCGNLFASTSKEWEIALEEVFLHREKYKKIGEKNKKIAMERYTFQANWKKYVQLFETIDDNE